MRFQTKMIAIYTMFLFVIALILGISFYKYSVRQYESAEKRNMEIAAEQLMTQMEDEFKPMELAVDYILSNPDALSAITLLSKEVDKSVYDQYLNDSKKKLALSINTNYMTYNFYRTIFFNQNGYVAATFNGNGYKIKAKPDWEKMPWLDQIESADNQQMIVNSHVDTWTDMGATQVYSLVKQIYGSGMGYIEIQAETNKLEKILQVANNRMDYLVFVNGTELLYSTLDEDNLQQYQKLITERTEKFVDKLEISDENKIVAKCTSDTYDLCVIAVESSKLNKEGSYILPMTILVAGIFFGISLIFITLISKYLTKPIIQLREIMGNTKLENIGDEIEIENANDEIEALGKEYAKLLERLQKSLVKEKRLSVLQLQAQFDTLQSQVNPHFLYNVLNIISARGMKVEDEKICEICDSLATMLRYSTNTKERYTTIQEEVEYLKHYFYLLKVRYEHKLEYSIKIDAEVNKQIIPKMVLQQIVENCINHGFENSVGQMQVDVIGGIDENGWYVKVCDNGEGFTEEAMARLRERFEGTKRQILKERNNMELEIGGMGLINSYARLLLLYNEDLVFEIHNGVTGAEVAFGNCKSNRVQVDTEGAYV